MEEIWLFFASFSFQSPKFPIRQVFENSSMCGCDHPTYHHQVPLNKPAKYQLLFFCLLKCGWAAFQKTVKDRAWDRGVQKL